MKFEWRNLILFFAWALPLTFLLTAMTGLHAFAVKPQPLSGLTGETGPMVHHFLSLDCACSRNLLKHLKSRHAVASAPEKIHLIHAESTVVNDLRSNGFQVEPIESEDAVARYGLQSLPQLVVVRNGETLYQGGYGKDQQHSEDYDDVAIIARALGGQKTDSYPLFGCANGKIRERLMDRLGIKYAKSYQE